ncbi:MAG: winged-helix domain-containing protein [Chloroflexi bacterium]|nr:winged-helix domain-containing protein [Chloroflexota bacterium]
MNELLFVDATEELQALAAELERAGFRIRSCPLDEAAEQISGGEQVDALLINLTAEPAEAAIRELLHTGRLPPHTATVAILSIEQLSGPEAELPIDELIVFPAPAEEAIARIRRAVRRRAGPESAHVLRCGDLTIDQASYKVFVAGRPVDLTYKEYELLKFLAQNQDKVCTREMLLNRVWGYDFYGGGRTVDVHIRRLRSKIEDRGHTFIQTVRNVGYRIHAG